MLMFNACALKFLKYARHKNLRLYKLSLFLLINSKTDRTQFQM